VSREEFVGRLRERRVDLGMTQAGVARRIHVSENALSTWERGVRKPTPGLARAWARALGADEDGAEVFAKPPPAPEPCGTPRGYKRHLEAGEVCRVCRKAWSNYVGALREQRGAGSE
jgi:transcriptional regulator with XRE-family HTH domain